jgi:hypothetical protein
MSHVTRDSFSGASNKISGMLAQRPGVENIPIGSPGKDRFKSTAVSPKRRVPPFALNVKESKGLHDESVDQDVTVCRAKTISTTLQGSSLDWSSKALPRRADWTPTKENDTTALVDASSPRVAALIALAASYSFQAPEHGPGNSCRPEIAHGPTKRRKIEPLGNVIPSRAASSSKASARPKPRAKGVTTKKPKSAPKKAKTITDLVTAHHSSGGKPTSAMAGFLVATQADAESRQTTDADGRIEVGIRLSKAKDTKKGRRTKLLSPNSAVKTFEQQETIFGSASQLWKDEPVVRVALSSDPVSPSRTQAMSIESVTPAKSYFVGRRNLWGAADRDEENALLHVDAIDLLDTPAAHPTPKEVTKVTQSGGLGTFDGQRKLAADPVGNLPALTARERNATSQVVDVDDFSSPAARVQAGYESGGDNGLDPDLVRSNASETQRQVAPQVARNLNDVVVSSRKSAQAPDKAKPNYPGMHTTELQKMIKGYGFKAIKSRQKMIDLLDKCWVEQEARRLAKLHAPQPTQHEPLKHSEIISNVHDLSSRPVPKPKGKRTRKNDKLTSDATPKSRVPKPPKKKAATDAKADEKPKKPRSKKAKNDAGDEQPASKSVVEVEEATGATGQMLVDNADDQMAKAPPSVLSLSQTAGEQPTHPALVRHSSKEPADNAIHHLDIREQIHAAILFQSENAALDSDRDHIREPTWHEKILMYDPIVIEDLARWLNAEGLNNIHEDREVSLIKVRDWCESSGICCMWKGGWRGQASR